MSTIALGRQHPYYWILTSILGQRPTAIANALRISTATVHRWEFGHNLTEHMEPKVRELITRLMSSDDYNNEAPSTLQEPLHRDWYRLTFQLLNAYLERVQHPPKPARKSNLQDLILANLPARRSYILGQLHQHTAFAIRRAARTAGVIEEPDPHNPSILLWRSPPNAPRHPNLKIAPTFVPARSKRSEQLQTLITVYLGRRHGQGQESIKASRLLAHVISHGHSKPSFYRAVRDMCLIRETTGFGKAKQTRYALPHLKEEPQ